MQDSFGREINYLRISITDLCNLRCQYCMPASGICKSEHENILSFEDFYTITKAFSELGVNKVRITGGEPLVKRDIIDFIKNINKLENIDEITMTTNGILLEEYAEDLKNAGLDRVNISLDTLDPKKYSEITRGGDLDKVLKGIKKMEELNLTPIKINAVLIDGFNIDEIRDLVELTRFRKIDVRFIELMPIGEVLNLKDKNTISGDIVLEKVKELEPTKRDDPSSPAIYYKLPGAKGKVGIIKPVTCKFCKDCNRIRLTSKGFLKLCLHSNEEIDLKPHLDNYEELKEFLIKTILKKPEEHHLEDGDFVSKSMSTIGG
ncbi:MAG: GTP 3',8-cyclase MoaA [Andreesenia angusta]|nr:GTP 3',8-cyclase MoaA [Andreesenia angusta]